METDKYILLLSVHVSYPRSDGILRTKAKAVPLGTGFEWRHGLDDGLIYNTSQHKLHGYSVFRTVPSAAFRTTWLSRGSIYDMARAAIVVMVKGRGGGDQPAISPSFKSQPTRKIGAKIRCAIAEETI
jgi:hypothetical protein